MIGVIELHADTGMLLEAVKVLMRIKPVAAEHAYFRFRDDMLRIRVGPSEVETPATGCWPGEARVRVAFLGAVARLTTRDRTVALSMRNDRLYVASTSVECHWNSAPSEPVLLPEGASLSLILKTGLEHTDEDLASSGVLPAVMEARAQCEERIKSAASTLQPFGVRTQDVERLVLECLQSSRTPQVAR
jgi:hypothetical protein